MHLLTFYPFLLGIVLAYIYEKTGSLYPSILLHIISNSIAFSAVLWK